MQRQTYRLAAAFLLGLFATAAMLALRGLDPLPLVNLRNSSFDLMQRTWPRQQKVEAVTIVDIDERSLAKLGQWPWPRDLVASLINKIGNAGASAIALDVMFPEADRLSPANVLQDPSLSKTVTLIAGAALRDNDQLLADALAANPSVAAAFVTARPGQKPAPESKSSFAFTGQDSVGAPTAFASSVSNIEAIAAAAHGTGIINIDLAENGGVARTLPLLWSDGKKLYPSLALEALRVASGASTYVVNGSATAADTITSIRLGDVLIPTADDGAIQLYYRPLKPEDSVSAADVLADPPLPAVQDKLDGHVVFIGTSSAGLYDLRQNTLGQTVPGVSVHAQAAEQIIQGQFLYRPLWSGGAEILFVGLMGVLTAALAVALRPGFFIAFYLALITLALGASEFMFLRRGILFDATFPMLAFTGIFLSSLAAKLLIAERLGRSLRSAFAYYVPEQVLGEIYRHPEQVSLGGESREITVMFVDMQDSTTITEKLNPQELVTVINRVLTCCTDAVIAHGGTIDKYIGDAVMAFWNAPLPQEDHQWHAAKAALAIQENIANLNQDAQFAQVLLAAGLAPIAVRAGMATGDAVIGNVGSDARLAYSALGEPVNHAARAQSAGKHFAADITLAGPLIGKSLDLGTLYCGRMQFKGTSKLVECHAIFSEMKDDALRAADAAVQAFQSGAKPSGAPSDPRQARFLERLPERREDYAA